MQRNCFWRIEFVLSLLVALVCGGCQTAKRAGGHIGPVLRVATYNVNFGNRGGNVVKAVAAIDADIICLQEADNFEGVIRESLGQKFPHIYFRATDYRRAGGYGFLSKFPAREIAWIDSEEWFGGWIMGFETPVGPVQVLNVHLMPPVKNGSWVRGYFFTGKDRLREIEEFYGRRDPNLLMIVAGDFNDTDGSRAVGFLKKRGFKNALPQFDQRSATWRWRVGLVTLKRRMDHVLYSLEMECFGARVMRVGTSDHFPVVAELGRRRGGG